MRQVLRMNLKLIYFSVFSPTLLRFTASPSADSYCITSASSTHPLLLLPNSILDLPSNLQHPMKPFPNTRMNSSHSKNQTFFQFQLFPTETPYYQTQTNTTHPSLPRTNPTLTQTLALTLTINPKTQTQ